MTTTIRNISLKEIISFCDQDIIHVFGDYADVDVKYLREPSKVDSHTLDWVNHRGNDKQQMAENSPAMVILTDSSVNYSEKLRLQKKILIQVENPKLVVAKIGNYFFKERKQPKIHPTALIHPQASIGKEVFIGANAVIGDCKIGNNVIIQESVIIHDQVEVGNEVIIKPGAVLGFEGFGYERLEDGSLIKFPQLGKLIIHDQVEIGSNTCIDKGALSDTIIGKGTKINNLCHIAHNVVTGRNVIITAQVNISGSTIIEDNVWIAPNASLRGHQRIGKGAVIGMGAVVTKDVPAGETWIGNPAKKHMKS